MERKEAVLAVFYKLEQAYSHPEANATLADEIVAELEKMGMLPPTTTLSKLGVIDNAWDEEN